MGRKRYPRRDSAFSLGDRVRFTKVAFDAGLAIDDGKSPLYGTIIGYGRMDGLIRVRREGRSTVEEYSGEFWEKAPTRRKPAGRADGSEHE